MTEQTSLYKRTDSKKDTSDSSIKVIDPDYEKLYKDSSVGISLIDTSGNWLAVNNALCKILGYNEKELLTKGCFEITVPEDIKKTKEFTKRLITGKTKHGILQKRYYHKNGHIVWTNLSMSLIKGTNHTPDYFMIVTEDITEQKKAETELQQYNRIHKRTSGY